MTDDESTSELRADQLRRERVERELAAAAPDEAAAHPHERRAEKASYLREKLSQRAESESEVAPGSTQSDAAVDPAGNSDSPAGRHRPDADAS